MAGLFELLLYLMAAPLSLAAQGYLFYRVHLRLRAWSGRPIASALLLLSMAAANLASLAFSVEQPPGGAFFATPATTLRGWPLPWRGLVGLAAVALPITFAIDTLLWSAAACAIFRLVAGAIPPARPAIQCAALALASAAAVALAYSAPFLLGPVVGS